MKRCRLQITYDLRAIQPGTRCRSSILELVMPRLLWSSDQTFARSSTVGTDARAAHFTQCYCCSSTICDSHHHAEQTDHTTRQGRLARRQAAFDGRGRIRTRGDRACAPRQTWRTLAATGDCDRLIEGAPRRSAIEATRTRRSLAANASESRARLRSWTGRTPHQRVFSTTAQRTSQGAQARAHLVGIAPRTFAAGEDGQSTTHAREERPQIHSQVRPQVCVKC